MSRVGETVQYGVMGIGVTALMWLILAFFPTIMVSLSIVDTFYDWNTVKIYIPKTNSSPSEMVEYVPSEHGSLQELEYDSEYFVFCDSVSFASACFLFCVLFLIIGAIQGGLVAMIRYTWIIVVPWFLLSIYPFYKWICWIYEEVPFYGIDWMPW